MFQFLRARGRTTVFSDSNAFWRHAESTQQIRHSRPGDQVEAEERLDLRAGQVIKAVLEEAVGPEEGADRVQMQNWDWNDDRCRCVYILRSAFRPEVIPRLQAVLEGEFTNFQIVIQLLDDWNSDPWGNLKLSATEIAIQRNVAQAYAIAT